MRFHTSREVRQAVQKAKEDPRVTEDLLAALEIKFHDAFAEVEANTPPELIRYRAGQLSVLRQMAKWHRGRKVRG